MGQTYGQAAKCEQMQRRDQSETHQCVKRDPVELVHADRMVVVSVPVL